MNSIKLCRWRTFFAAVLFETDEGQFKSRIAEASKAIDERLQLAGEIGSIERISIETAQRSLAALERKPSFASRLRTEKAVIFRGSDVPDAEVKRIRHGIGSHVRVRLPSGEPISGEIVVIFTASAGKNILVSFGNRLMRVGPEQILDCMSAKA
jgi:hypothetical protein